MRTVTVICLTVILCWMSLLALVVFALRGHQLTRVERFTTVEVRGK